MINTLLITILMEELVAVIYSTRRKKPAVPILLTSVFGNLLTQPMLWIVLTLSFRYYLVALAITEIMIWGIESILFHTVSAKHLSLKEAGLLIFVLNGISLGLGWFVPI